MVSVLFIVLSIICVIFIPFVSADNSFKLLMGSLLSMMIGLMPLLYYKYGGKISLSRLGEYVNDYDEIVMDEKLLECSPESVYEISKKWFIRNLNILEENYPYYLKGYFEWGDAPNNPKYYPRIVKISISSEENLSRVKVALDSPYVLSDEQIERVKQTWPEIIDEYWSFLENNLDKNIKWYTNGL